MTSPDALRDSLARAIARSGFEPDAPFACPYLPGRMARHLNVLPEPLTPGVYQALMDLNFRRSAELFYRPACAGCNECRVVRIPVEEFRPNRVQRRCLKRNADVEMSLAIPAPSAEKYALYRRYLAARHVGPMDGSREEFERFLYTSTVETVEICYRAQGRLLAVGIADVEPRALSAVYCYYDAAQAARSLGVLNVLFLLAECGRRGLAHLYLGYYVRGCRQMSYKARFQPCELLLGDGRYVRLTAPPAARSLAP